MVGIASISAILTNHVRSNVSLAAGNNGCGQHMKLEDAPHGYDIFQKKQDGAFKVVLNP